MLQMILLPIVGEQELRSLSNMIFHQEEKDCVVDKEVIPMQPELKKDFTA